MAAQSTDIAKFIALLKLVMQSNVSQSDGGDSAGRLLSAIQDSLVSQEQTLTNKTIDLSSNTLTGTIAQFNTAVSDANLATIAGAETLTNKTLTAPVFSSSPTGDGVTQWAEVTITNTEALALRAAPKTLVAAPGAGKVLEFVSLQLFLDYTAAYTESTANLAVKFENGSGAAVSQAIEATGFADATADTITNGLAKIDAIVAKTGSENKALVLHNTGAGEWGGGDAANVIRAKVAYRVWSTGF
jgi:hypothetical protein